MRLGFALAIAACASSTIDPYTTTTSPPQFAEQPPAAPPPENGQVRVALILPLSAQGNAGVAAQSMKNAAEMALAEFKQPTVHLLMKDAGNPYVLPKIAQQLASTGVNLKGVHLLGSGLWDDPRVYSDAELEGGWFAAPEQAGYQHFVARYRKRFGQEPERTATLAMMRSRSSLPS